MYIASFGRFEVVAGNARENFDQAAAQVGVTVQADVFERLKALTETELERLRPLIEDRARRGAARPATPTATCAWTMSTSFRIVNRRIT